jgi:hypothetical protein
MQDRKGLDPGYLVPGTWYLAPVPNSHTSNLNKALPACRARHSIIVHGGTSVARPAVSPSPLGRGQGPFPS